MTINTYRLKTPTMTIISNPIQIVRYFNAIIFKHQWICSKVVTLSANTHISTKMHIKLSSEVRIRNLNTCEVHRVKSDNAHPCDHSRRESAGNCLIGRLWHACAQSVIPKDARTMQLLKSWNYIFTGFVRFLEMILYFNFIF